jgi:hypothetical protein
MNRHAEPLGPRCFVSYSLRPHLSRSSLVINSPHLRSMFLMLSVSLFLPFKSFNSIEQDISPTEATKPDTMRTLSDLSFAPLAPSPSPWRARLRASARLPPGDFTFHIISSCLGRERPGSHACSSFVQEIFLLSREPALRPIPSCLPFLFCNPSSPALSYKIFSVAKTPSILIAIFPMEAGGKRGRPLDRRQCGNH